MGYNSQQGEDKYVYENFIKGKISNGFFIELGAVDGIKYSNSKFFEDSLGFTGILIEPSLNQFEKLIKNRPNCNNFNYAISKIEGEVDFKGNDEVGGMVHTMAESFHKGWYENDKYPHLKNLTTYKAKSIPLHKILKQVDVKKVDLFFIDVEGGELEVLETMDWSIPVYIIVIELDNHNAEKDEKCRKIMISNGLTFYSILGINEVWINNNYEFI